MSPAATRSRAAQRSALATRGRARHGHRPRHPDARAPVVLFVHGGAGASELAARYLDALRAPARRLVWLEPSAHDAPFEEPERFRAALLEAVAAAG